MQEIISDTNWELLEKCSIESELDIVKARQSVRQYAKNEGMGIVDQTRITTAVSELLLIDSN
jgi:serine/threonine-protein kinase RsbT